MKKKNIHVVPHKDGWAVKRSGNDKATTLHSTKKDAMNSGRPLARRDEVELVIHGKNGRIQDKDSYGNDPCPPKDNVH